MATAPLDADGLREIALRYAGRYATTRAKLARYLAGKLRQRGWAAAEPADVGALVERMADLGLVNDADFAEAQVRAMGRRGLGARRMAGALAAAGIDPELRAEALQEVDGAAAALAYARKRRLGRFRESGPGDRVQAQKDMAAMLRAGHGFQAAKVALGGAAAEFADDAG